MRVLMLPTPQAAAVDTSNSIHQIVLKLQKYLPNYGVELVESGHDIVAGHAGQTMSLKPVDVAHCHGLYPTAHHEYNNAQWHWHANKAVINNLVSAKAITVPSQWVANIIRRDMHVDPIVQGWAIEPSDWQAGVNGGYVLWNKNRSDGVCNPEPVVKLASLAPDVLFLSTFGDHPTPNLRVVGRQSYDAMRPMIQNANVYLATTLETFGIGTLEAMACGVPVLGWKWGGTADIVKHGETGYLVEPYDYDGLLQGLRYCLLHRDTLGHNARIEAQRYTWDKVAQVYASLYKGVAMPSLPTRPKVSVIIPAYNYGQYLAQAIQSVIAQETQYPFEIIVVDDGSTDNTAEVASANLRVQDTYLYKSNSGVADTRNLGISKAQGQYILCLDADDALGHPAMLQLLSEALDKDPTTGMVFTGLRVMNAEGVLSPHINGFPSGYDYALQMAGRNQVPTCNMFRKEAWRRAGGFRKRYTPAEDADMWLRMGALGYKGEHVIGEGWFHYRLHSASLSSVVRTGAKKEPEWTKDKGWILTNQPPFAATHTPKLASHPVRNYLKPVVSVIVPCAEYHKPYLIDALDSVEAQTYKEWELIVVDQTDKGLTLADMPSHPYAKIVKCEKRSAAAARNCGVANASAPLITFLDADDYYDPLYLAQCLEGYKGSGYTYTDWKSINKQGVEEINRTPNYDPHEVFKRTSIHGICILMSKIDFVRAGGFDESMNTWEDTDFFMRLAAMGICGVRVPEPLFTYRYQTGQLREMGETKKQALIDLLKSRYGEYMTGAKMCDCIVPKPKQEPTPQQALNTLLNKNAGEEMIRIRYNGGMARHSVHGKVTNTMYGRRSNGDRFFIHKSDMVAEPELFTPESEPFSPDVQATPLPVEPTLWAAQ